MNDYVWTAYSVQLALLAAVAPCDGQQVRIACGKEDKTVAIATLSEQESNVPDDATPDQFEVFWAERFGPQRVDPEIRPLEFVSYESHVWRLDSDFSETFPRLTKALRRSATFDVSYKFPSLADHRNLFVFWKASDGTLLTWVLDPPVEGARQKGDQLKMPSLGRLWKQFGGFDNVSTWYMGNRDLPNAASDFTGLFDVPSMKLEGTTVQLFKELCDDASFRRRMGALRSVGDDFSGNHLAVEPGSESLFYLTRDGDLLGRRGVTTRPIGSGDTSVYIIEGAETPAKLLELCAEHILKQLPTSPPVAEPAVK